jgi:hypothetical protein
MSTSEASGNVPTILDLLAETIDARVEKEQLDNITAQGLAVAEDVDKYSRSVAVRLIKTRLQLI